MKTLSSLPDLQSPEIPLLPSQDVSFLRELSRVLELDPLVYSHANDLLCFEPSWFFQASKGKQAPLDIFCSFLLAYRIEDVEAFLSFARQRDESFQIWGIDGLYSDPLLTVVGGAESANIIEFVEGQEAGKTVEPWDWYMKSLPNKKRYNLKREYEMAKDYNIRFASEWEDVFDPVMEAQYRRLDATLWKDATAGPLYRNRWEKLLKTTILYYQSQGRIHLTILETKAGVPVAVDIGLSFQDRWFCLSTLWDPESSNAGMIVSAHTMPHIAKSGFRYCDLMPSGDYKVRYNPSKIHKSYSVAVLKSRSGFSPEDVRGYFPPYIYDDQIYQIVGSPLDKVLGDNQRALLSRASK